MLGLEFALLIDVRVGRRPLRWLWWSGAADGPLGQEGDGGAMAGLAPWHEEGRRGGGRGVEEGLCY